MCVLISVKVLYEEFLYTVRSHCLQAMDSGIHLRIYWTPGWIKSHRNVEETELIRHVAQLYTAVDLYVAHVTDLRKCTCKCKEEL